MTPDQWADLIYLGLLGTVITGIFLLNQTDLKGQIKNALVWFLIFIGATLVYGQWENFQRLIDPARAIVGAENKIIIRRSEDSHFYVNILVNNRPIKFLIDTGATNIVLSKADAQKIGINVEDLNFTGLLYTANGVTRTARIRLNEMVLGPFAQRNMTAMVNEGELWSSLLGMDFLNQFSEVSIRNNEITLIP